MNLKIEPCIFVGGKTVEEKTVKEHFAKIDKAINEVKAVTLALVDLDAKGDIVNIFLSKEVINAMTALMTFARAIGVEPSAMEQAAIDVYLANKARGRI